MQDKVLGLLGIAERAGKLESGGYAAEKALQEGKAFLILVTEDAQKNTVKKFTDKCVFRNVPLRRYSTGAVLGHAIGKEVRTCAAVTDAGIAAAVLRQLDSNR